MTAFIGAKIFTHMRVTYLMWYMSREHILELAHTFHFFNTHIHISILDHQMEINACYDLTFCGLTFMRGVQEQRGGKHVLDGNSWYFYFTRVLAMI